MIKSIVVLVALVLGTLTASSQHREHYQQYRNHNQVIINNDHRSFYRFNQHSGGRFVHRGGYYNGRPYYGGLRIYSGVNIFPCTEYDFVNGYCYPYDYAYYPDTYSGWSVGIHIR